MAVVQVGHLDMIVIIVLIMLVILVVILVIILSNGLSPKR